MQLELLNDQGQAASKFEAPETVFGRAYNEDLVHQIVVAYQANARQGTRAQKDREQVKHSTKKPFKQKGTGNARQGSSRSSINVGGGRTFGPVPRSYYQRTPKEMMRGALRCALSDRVKAQRFVVVDEFNLKSHKTKEWDRFWAS
jgi:large subunit ribosomal protein L4